ncbi:hypothetical protein ROHU_028987 [Labeo rohita]|uniref:Uncharacterized protein n=1 Tax=Labeo rohita TaxID=84645 RepID=A0A498LYE4_LABRO|nr:hypothetical protein ROHU_028987 [Labeo rohita]
MVRYRKDQVSDFHIFRNRNGIGYFFRNGSWLPNSAFDIEEKEAQRQQFQEIADWFLICSLTERQACGTVPGPVPATLVITS